MQMSLHKTLALGLGLIALTLGTVGSPVTAAQPPEEGEGERPGSPSERSLIHGTFFPAMTSGDLLLLQDGGVLGGTLTAESFEFVPASGPAESYPRDRIAAVNLGGGDEADQMTLINGETLVGQFSTGELAMSLPNGSDANISQTGVGTIILQKTPEEFYQVMRGLRSLNMFAVFAKALTTYDTVIFANDQILSGQIANESFTFTSPTFGTFTASAEDVAELELAASADEEGGDAITLRTGDRVTGTLAEDSLPQFQPIGIAADDGQANTMTLERGQMERVVFRMPASAFGGGGRGPGIGGGPGN